MPATSKDPTKALVQKQAASMATNLNDVFKKLMAKDKKIAEIFKGVKFSVSKNPDDNMRTPQQQAVFVCKGTSEVCWGAHMADKARHVYPIRAGRVIWKHRKAFSDQFALFQTTYVAAIKNAGLVNAAGKDGWYDKDPYHVELPNSKIDRSGVQAQACIDHYVTLTRVEAKKKNSNFEKKYSPLIKASLKRQKINE